MYCATEIPLIDSNPRFTWTTSALSNLLLASVLRLQMGLGRKIASCELKWLLQHIAGSQTEYPRPLWHFQKVPSLVNRELEFWVQPRLSLPGSLQFGTGPNWSQFIAGLASGLIFSCIFLDSLFQLGLFHKSLIFLFLIYMLRFSVEFNVLAENAHNTEHKCPSHYNNGRCSIAVRFLACYLKCECVPPYNLWGTRQFLYNYSTILHTSASNLLKFKNSYYKMPIT